MDWQNAATMARDIATAGAVIGALVFFLYRIVAGWLLVNLSVKLETQRISDAQGNDDHLVVNIALSKGKIDAARLLSAELRVQASDAAAGNPQTRKVSGIRRLRFSDSGPEWEGEDARNKYLTLSSEETMYLAEHFRVKRGLVYRVDIVVQCDRFRERIFPSLAQWRSSAIVLPVASMTSSC